MRTLIAFYSKTGNTERTANLIADGLQKAKPECKVVFQRLLPLKKFKLKKTEVKLKDCLDDWNGFDLVIIGSPVRNFSSHRVVNAYLKQCKNIKGKKAALFLTCMAMPGKAIKKMSGMINAEGGEIIDYLVLSGLIGLSDKKLEKAREFGEKLPKNI